MPDDRILTFKHYIEDISPNISRAASDYTGWLEDLYQRWIGDGMPSVPEEIETTVDALVDAGRWLWHCKACNGGIPAEPDLPSICPACATQGWVNVKFPDNKDDIEAELLKQPGRRARSPIRHWRPGWTVDDLKERTKKAKAKLDKGEDFIRTLSIGVPRIWMVDEVLTASHMNTYVSDILRDLAGDDGIIELRVRPASTGVTVEGGLRIPRLTTSQRTAQTTTNGTMVYDEDIERVRIYEDGAWRILGSENDIQSDLIGDNGIIELRVRPASTGVTVEGGLRIPRLTTSQRTAQTTTNGTMVYDEDIERLWAYQDDAWSIFGSEFMPSGTIVEWAGEASSIPTGFLACDASSVSMATYGTLFNVIGFTYSDPPAYALDVYADELWEIDITTPGDSTKIGDLPSGLTDPSSAFTFDGKAYAIDVYAGDELWEIDITTPGDSTKIGDLPSAIGISSSAFALDGKAYAIDDSGDELWEIDITTPGDSTEIGDLPSGIGTPSAAFALDGKAYVIDSDGDELWEIDITTPGDSTEIGDLPSGLTYPSAAFALSGKAYAIDSDGDELWEIDITTPGDSTKIGDLPSGITYPLAAFAFDGIFSLPELTSSNTDVTTIIKT